MLRRNPIVEEVEVENLEEILVEILEKILEEVEGFRRTKQKCFFPQGDQWLICGSEFHVLKENNKNAD